MAACSSLRRVVAPVALVTALGSASAIAVNIATGDSPGPLVWPAVALLTVLSALASLWLHHRSQDAPATTGPTGSLVKIRDTHGDLTVSAIGSVHSGLPPAVAVFLVAAAAVPALLYGIGGDRADPAPQGPPAASVDALPRGGITCR